MRKSFSTYFTRISLGAVALLTALVNVASATFIGSGGNRFEPSLESVAYIDTDTPQNSYYTVEEALKDATSGQTIYIRPGQNPVFFGKGDTPNEYNTVKKGVTLMLPVPNAEGAFYEGWTVTEGQAVVTGSSYIKKNQKLQTRMSLGEDATLFNYGTITIGGELSGGAGGDESAGHTQGKYSEILMHDRSKIICGSESSGESGLLKCFGYISEAENAESDLIMERGEARMPFLVRDFRGGNASASIYWPYVPLLGRGPKHAIPPFNQFEFRNIESRVEISYTASLSAYCNIYSGDQHNFSLAKIVGSTPEYLIQFTDPTHSTFVSKYDPASEICDVSLYGGAKMNALKLSIKKPIEVNISTNDVFFPLSWRFHLNLEKTPSQAKAVFTANQRLKLLPGASMTIGDGAELNASELTSLDFSPDNPRTDPGFNDTAYPVAGLKYVRDKYPNSKENARLVVKGTLNAATVGGVLSPHVDGLEGILSISNAATITTYEASNQNRLAPCEEDTLVNPARGPQSASGEITPLSTAPYLSRGTHWVKNEIPYTITYQSFLEPEKRLDPTSMSNHPNNPTSANTAQEVALQNPTYTGSMANIRFAGWYYGFDAQAGECFDRVENNRLTGSAVASHLNDRNELTVTARWVQARALKVEYQSFPGTHSTFDTSKEEALTGVDYILPQGESIEFIGLDASGNPNEAHRPGTFKAWQVLDTEFNPIHPETLLPGQSVVIPADYPGDKIILRPDIQEKDEYKIFVEVRSGAQNSDAGMAKILYGDPETDALGGGKLTNFQNYVFWVPLDTPIRVWLDWHGWLVNRNKISVEMRTIHGDALVEGPLNNKQGSALNKVPVETGRHQITEDGMRIIFDGHR